MDYKHVNRQIDEIERHLRIEDPALSRRVEQRRRREAAQAVAVFTLLASSAVLLATGLATISPVVYCAGVAAFLAAFVADRQLGTARRSRRNPTPIAAVTVRATTEAMLRQDHEDLTPMLPGVAFEYGNLACPGNEHDPRRPRLRRGRAANTAGVLGHQAISLSAAR